MKNHLLFRLAVATFLTGGMLIAASCQKDEVVVKNPTSGGSSTTVTKAVKGTTRVKLWSEACYAPVDSPRDIVECPISNMFDIRVEAVAGGEKKTGGMTGDTLVVEASTTTLPNSGSIKVTLTRKSSFTPDPSVKYVIDLGKEFRYITAYSDGHTATQEGCNLADDALRLVCNGSELTTAKLDNYAKQASSLLSGSCPQAFGY